MQSVDKHTHTHTETHTLVNVLNEMLYTCNEMSGAHVMVMTTR